MSDDYECVARGSLKLKTTDGISKKKSKKKKEKEAKKYLEQITKTAVDSDEQDSQDGKSQSKEGPSLTKAEKSFLKMQDKRQITRIMDKASKSHKQRVEEFNRHLDSLTEHYDIPKVSWTK